MPNRRQPPPSAAVTSYLFPSGGRHLWPSGETSAEVAHDRGHLVYAAKGVLSISSPHGNSIVPANRVSWTPGGVEHSHRAHGATDIRIVFLAPSLARRLPDRPAVFLKVICAREVLLALTGPRNYRPGGERYSGGARSRLLRVLVDELRETDEQALHLPEPKDDRLRSVARKLRDTPGDNSTLEELGRAAGASTRTLSRLFREELGMTFYEWRTQLRIHHALVLLAEGHDTTHIAHACGWANPSGFIAAFTYLVGTTPGRYRAGGERDLQ